MTELTDLETKLVEGFRKAASGRCTCCKVGPAFPEMNPHHAYYSFLSLASSVVNEAQARTKATWPKEAT